MSRRRTVLWILAGLLAVVGCREDKPRPELTAADNALLRDKADEKIGIIIRENLPALFAGVVVFRSDVFLSQSYMLDKAGISVLNAFGNTAILLLNSPDILPMLRQDAVKRMTFLCRQRGLARLHPAFELDVLRRFGEGKDDAPVSIMVRFREPPPDEQDGRLLEAAGFAVRSRAGYIWTIAGPLRSLPRLLEYDRIIYYEGASNVRPM